MQKDPIYRINWDELKNHPWWQHQGPETPSKVVTYKYNFTKRLY